MRKGLVKCLTGALGICDEHSDENPTSAESEYMCTDLSEKYSPPENKCRKINASTILLNRIMKLKKKKYKN